MKWYYIFKPSLRRKEQEIMLEINPPTSHLSYYGIGVQLSEGDLIVLKLKGFGVDISFLPAVRMMDIDEITSFRAYLETYP